MGSYLSIPMRTPVSERTPADVLLKLAIKQLSQGLADSYRPIVQIVLPECLARMVMDYAIDPIGMFIGLSDLCTFEIGFPWTYWDIPIEFSFFEIGDRLEIVMLYGQSYFHQFELDKNELAWAIENGAFSLILQKKLTSLINVPIPADEIQQRHIHGCAEEAIGDLNINYIKRFMHINKSLLSK